MITLFGCGGDRDRTKRPLMGMAAGELSDFVVLTSDNPRSEDPLDIMNDALVGLRRFDTPHVAEPDRAKAIRLARSKKPAGRCGAAGGQGARDVSGAERPDRFDFDDRETARDVLLRMRLGYSEPAGQGADEGSAAGCWADDVGIEQLAMRGDVMTGWSVDSRTVQPGDLFFALRGPNCWTDTRTSRRCSRRALARWSWIGR